MEKLKTFVLIHKVYNKDRFIVIILKRREKKNTKI